MAILSRWRGLYHSRFAGSYRHLVIRGRLNGLLYAVNPVSGEEQWRFEAAGGIYASPLVVGDTVYIATQKGSVYAVDGQSGGELWQLTLDAGVNEPMAFADGVLYLRTSDGAVVAIE